MTGCVLLILYMFFVLVLIWYTLYVIFFFWCDTVLLCTLCFVVTHLSHMVTWYSTLYYYMKAELPTFPDAAEHSLKINQSFHVLIYKFENLPDYGNFFPYPTPALPLQLIKPVNLSSAGNSKYPSAKSIDQIPQVKSVLSKPLCSHWNISYLSFKHVICQDFFPISWFLTDLPAPSDCLKETWHHRDKKTCLCDDQLCRYLLEMM